VTDFSNNRQETVPSGNTYRHSHWPDSKGAYIFEIYRSNREILGSIRMTCTKFHTEGPQILGATVQNVLSRPIWLQRSLFPSHQQILFLNIFYWCAFVGLLHCINMQNIFVKCTVQTTNKSASNSVMHFSFILCSPPCLFFFFKWRLYVCHITCQKQKWWQNFHPANGMLRTDFKMLQGFFNSEYCLSWNFFC
jgi:hypothetical protein